MTLKIGGTLTWALYAPPAQEKAYGDLAVVQRGLTTAMEMTAAQRPVPYFPLRHHFEQTSTSGTG